MLTRWCRKLISRRKSWITFRRAKTTLPLVTNQWFELYSMASDIHFARRSLMSAAGSSRSINQIFSTSTCNYMYYMIAVQQERKLCPKHRMEDPDFAPDSRLSLSMKFGLKFCLNLYFAGYTMHPKQQKHIARHDLVAANALWVPSYEFSCHPRAKNPQTVVIYTSCLPWRMCAPRMPKLTSMADHSWSLGSLELAHPPGCLFMFRLLQPPEDRKAKSYYWHGGNIPF